ncbi:MAG: VOC family protein [Chloroflexota bacterium]|nr:VOC family protein [Chloroflexota bacterium]
MAAIRYIVNDVDAALAFYRDLLDFKLQKHSPGRFAEMAAADLTLYLSAPGAGSGGQAGGDPRPGGWNRFMVITTSLDSLTQRLRTAGAHFRGKLSDGGAGRSILLEDPSGNPIELFEFKHPSG